MKHKNQKRKKAIRTQKDFLETVPHGYAPPKHFQNPEDQPKHVRIVKQKFVKDWLIRGWKITSQIAWRNFGVTRLADIVFRMRRRAGFIIKTKTKEGIDRFGTTVRYGEYKLNKSRSKKAIARYKKKLTANGKKEVSR